MNVWESVKSRLSVDEVISSYIPILSSGGNYRCVCPFHKEKNPSLIISPQKGIWHCFGCGAGGDIFKFVEEYEHISKAEALQILAKKAGIELEKMERKPVASTEQITQQELGFKYLNFAAETYHKILLKLLQDKNNRITQYCLSRGLTMEIINQFQIGYAPTGNFLLKLGQKHGLDNLIFTEVGLLKQVEQPDAANQLKDKFTDRLILPIWDKQGRAVGFTGRSIPPDKTERPKYLNSPQNNWFNKSQIWYGWHLARTNILQEKKVIVVEGNMDVVASFQAGLHYTMASQGTSFTEAQIKMLSTITKTIWLAFDNDEAGKLSSNKFFKLASQYNLQVLKVLIPSKHKDLDEYLKSDFSNTFNTASPKGSNIQLETKPYLDYILTQKSTDLVSNNANVQKQAILYTLDLISVLDQISKEQYLLKLSQITKLSVSSLSAELEKIIKAISNHIVPKLEEEGGQYGFINNSEANSKNNSINNFVNNSENNSENNSQNRSKTEKFQKILVSWQNLVAIYLNSFTLNQDNQASKDSKDSLTIQNQDIQNAEVTSEYKLDVLYQLLKIVFPQDLLEDTIQDYVIRSHKELELIKENITEISQTKSSAIGIISSFIDNNPLLFSRNTSVQDFYLDWKQQGKS